jgi:hypothetical protein
VAKANKASKTKGVKRELKPKVNEVFGKLLGFGGSGYIHTGWGIVC